MAVVPFVSSHIPQNASPDGDDRAAALIASSESLAHPSLAPACPTVTRCLPTDRCLYFVKHNSPVLLPRRLLTCAAYVSLYF